MKQLHKDNHYVPKLYLKQWAHAGKIATYRLLVPSDNYPLWKEYSLRGIAFHQNLYTYLAGQEETDEFERWIDSEFERPAEESINRVILEQRLSQEHWRRLVRFAAAQDVRTPARLREFLNRQQKILQKEMNEVVEHSINTLEMAVQNGTLIPSVETNRENPLPLRISIEKQPDGSGNLQVETVIGRRLWIWQMKHLLTQTLSRLPKHRWTILHAPAGMSWPTSDNPLVRLNFHDAKNYDFAGGWGVEHGDILLPLSPKHLLYTCIGKRPWMRGTTLDEATARLIRKIIIEHADRYIFSQEPGDIYLMRPRVVSSEAYTHEKDAWRNWHNEQCQAETKLLSSE